MARQCPDGKTVQLEKKNGPSGMTTSNINFDIEALQDLTKTADDLHIGLEAMSFNLKSLSNDADSEDKTLDSQFILGLNDSASDEDNDNELIKHDCNFYSLNSNEDPIIVPSLKHVKLERFLDDLMWAQMSQWMYPIGARTLRSLCQMGQQPGYPTMNRDAIWLLDIHGLVDTHYYNIYQLDKITIPTA
ncbi:hypothetical protein IW262DRAFT_1292292 [Armillaria fumosa]|nr:hypothetical protein IW262DRAFT_1292292 [Armillaria fumosa]